MKLAILVLSLTLGAPAFMEASAQADTTIYPPSGPVVVVDPAPAPQGPRGMRGQRGQRGPRGNLRQALVPRFDANGDGRLGPRERHQLLRAVRRLEKRLAMAENRANRAGFVRRHDRNGDGNVGPGEIRPQQQRKLRRFDRNNDGWVSPGEP